VFFLTIYLSAGYRQNDIRKNAPQKWPFQLEERAMDVKFGVKMIMLWENF